MNIVEFIKDRIADDLAGLGPAVTSQLRREALAKYKILELHEKWPILVTGPMTFDSKPVDPNNFAITASQQVEWMTNLEYIQKFGTEPPTGPIVKALAAIYCDHPDYDPEWV